MLKRKIISIKNKKWYNNRIILLLKLVKKIGVDKYYNKIKFDINMLSSESNKILAKRTRYDNPEGDGYDQCEYFENENVGNSDKVAKA